MRGLCADIHAETNEQGHAAKMSSPKMSALCRQLCSQSQEEQPACDVCKQATSSADDDAIFWQVYLVPTEPLLRKRTTMYRTCSYIIKQPWLV